MKNDLKETPNVNNHGNDENLNYSIFFILIIAVAIFVGINNTFFKEKNEETIELAIGETYLIKTYNETYNWKSTDPSIATIDTSGNIKALNSGTVKIIATNNEEIIYEYTIEITKKEIDIISFKEKDIYITVNDKYTLEINEEYNFSTLTWKSSNEDIVKVDKGKITALKEGISIITVTTKTGMSDTCNVTVLKQQKLEKIEFSTSSKNIYIGEKYQSEIIYKPYKINSNITYKSSNEKIATVSSSGIISGIAEGETIITATVNGLTTKINIKVIKNVDKTISINFNKNGADYISKDKESCNIKNNSCKITFPNISREGYKIVGWSKNNNSTKADYQPGETVTVYSNETYYAITYKTITAKFNSNRANISKNSESCNIYNNDNSCKIESPTISRNNYKILGWGLTSDTNDIVIQSGGILTINSPKTYYAITKINKDGIITGCTGWMAATNYYYSSPSSSSTKNSISVGTAFTIEEESGNYFKVKIPDVSESKYILHKYVMINLSDYIPSMTFEISNASSSVYKTSNHNLPNVTGTKLYSTGKIYNLRLRKNEYPAPILYKVAKKLLTAQNTLLSKGYSIKVYDTYRPHSVSTKIYNSLISLYNSNSTVKENINYSYGASGKKYRWGASWFLSSSVSNHNTGSAIDMTLVDSSGKEVQMPTAMHELSTKAIKYYSPNVSKVPANYSKEMNDAAKLMDSAATSAGLTTLASEWWHFQDSDAHNQILSLEKKGCDFQITKIYSY